MYEKKGISEMATLVCEVRMCGHFLLHHIDAAYFRNISRNLNEPQLTIIALASDSIKLSTYTVP